ncbi:MAG: thioesterase [Epsilonproteobacteria bacterium]|nr:thioesterase [Campylobacterota bacterium]
MELNTHLKIDNTLNGEVIELKEGYAKIALKTTEVMVADAEGLVHGGFCFGAADFAAMAAVNDPFVVLAKSEVKFLAPVKVGEEVVFEGQVTENDGRKFTVSVTGCVGEKRVFTGTFYTAVLKQHVLSL